MPGVTWNTIRTPSTVSSWPVVRDVDRRRDQRRLTGRGGLAEAGADLSGRALLERGAVHVAGAAGHRGAGEDVLGDRVVHEALGGDHLDPPGLDVLLGDDPLHATEVVDVGVRVDHREDRALTAVLGVERERRRRGLLGDERVDDDHAGVALDDAHDRQVVAADLVDAGHDLEQAVLDQQLALAPQARIRGVRGWPVEERVSVEIPHDPTVSGTNLPDVAASDEASIGVVEVLHVVHRQRRCRLRDGSTGGIGGE